MIFFQNSHGNAFGNTISLVDQFADTRDNQMKNLENLKKSPLMKLILSQVFLPDISVRVEISRGELFLIVLKAARKLNAPLSGISLLFRVVNSIFSIPVLAKTSYLIDKLCNPQENVTFHTVCSHCKNYLGKSQDNDIDIQCTICERITNCNRNKTFALIDPSEAIADYLELYEDHYDFVVKERKSERNVLSDIYDGDFYKTFVNSLPEKEKHQYVSVIISSDGTQTFESSNKST